MRKPSKAVQEHLRQGRRQAPVPYADRAPRLDVDRADEAWINALAAVDENDDNGPLRALFRAGVTYSPRIGAYLDDLLERRPFRGKRGGRKTPLYGQTYAEWRISEALAEVRRMVSEGMANENAINAVATDRDLHLTTLRNAFNGRRASTRRDRKRRAPTRL